MSRSLHRMRDIPTHLVGEHCYFSSPIHDIKYSVTVHFCGASVDSLVTDTELKKDIKKNRGDQAYNLDVNIASNHILSHKFGHFILFLELFLIHEQHIIFPNLLDNSIGAYISCSSLFGLIKDTSLLIMDFTYP